jgi:GTPase SAR1 family protein
MTKSPLKVLPSDKSVDVSYWIKSLDENCKEGVVKALVGNKVDLAENRQVTSEEGKALAAKHKMFFYETSAKTGINVDEVFLTVGNDIIKRNPNIVVESSNKTLKQTQDKEKEKSSCC